MCRSNIYESTNILIPRCAKNPLELRIFFGLSNLKPAVSENNQHPSLFGWPQQRPKSIWIHLMCAWMWCTNPNVLECFFSSIFFFAECETKNVWAIAHLIAVNGRSLAISNDFLVWKFKHFVGWWFVYPPVPFDRRRCLCITPHFARHFALQANAATCSLCGH